VPVNALVLRRAQGGVLLEIHSVDENGRQYIDGDTANTPNRLHAIIEKASLFVTPPPDEWSGL
jgi:hypothetical protein